jgi:hypothetical protein
MTLIYVGNSDGCVGRCDARCYEATTPDCHCICRGKNHGVGLSQARANTEALARQQLAEWQKVGAHISPELLQKDLL